MYCKTGGNSGGSGGITSTAQVTGSGGGMISLPSNPNPSPGGNGIGGLLGGGDTTVPEISLPTTTPAIGENNGLGLGLISGNNNISVPNVSDNIPNISNIPTYEAPTAIVNNPISNIIQNPIS